MSSHASRRGQLVECPLASLGRNTPSLDTQGFNHPLSTSPLNPQVYQMSRKSPILDVDSGELFLPTQRSAGVGGATGNSLLGGESQMYNLSRSSSSSMDQSYGGMRRDVDMKPFRRPPPPRNYTPIDSLLAYHHDRLSPMSMDREKFHMHNPTDGNGCTSGFLEEKMDSLYLQGAIRNPGTRINSDRFFLEQSMDNMCAYPSGSSRIDSSSPHHHLMGRRASSPSETSGSDRYALDGMGTGSAAMVNVRLQQLAAAAASTMYHRGQPTIIDSQSYSIPKTPNFEVGLTKLGRFSPSMDQGYHTLASPSPSGQQTPGPWNKKSTCRSGPVFDRLSDDTVMKVFAWLDSAELCNLTRVCRRFECLAWNPILWKIITIRGENICGDRALRNIFRRLCGQTRNGVCPTVERVMLSDGCRLSDKGMQLLARRCPELTHLQIQNSNVTNMALFDVVTRCTNVQHLDITGCSQITCVNLNPGVNPSQRLLLQYVDLTDCSSISDGGLKVLVRNCPQLIYLYLRRCIQITDAGLKFVPSFCIALRELSVSDCSNITDFGLYELAKLGATLRYLSVAKCDQVSDAGLKVIARRCYKIRYLNARGCEAVSDDSIIVLARSCPRLRALDIGKCDVSDAGLRALAESCPNLKKLSLRNCDMITDRGVQCIAYYCRGLQQLNIQDCQISLEGYRAVKKYCKRCVIEHCNPGFC